MRRKYTDNILTDLYNMQLSRNPKKDQLMIMDFFSKYDPDITKYKTAKEIKDVNSDNFGILLSLGGYEYIEGCSWSETEDIKYFYELQCLVRDIVDRKIDDEPIQALLIRASILYVFLYYGRINISRRNSGLEPLCDKINKIARYFCFNILEYSIFEAILDLLNGKTVIRKCKADDCQKAFIPRTLKQVYHSATCRSREGKRRERYKIKTRQTFGSNT